MQTQKEWFRLVDLKRLEEEKGKSAGLENARAALEQVGRDVGAYTLELVHTYTYFDVLTIQY